MHIRTAASKRFGLVMKRIGGPSLPVWFSLTFGAAIALNDAALAARIGCKHVAAMGFCEPLWLLIALATTGLCSGVTVGLAQTKQQKSQSVLFLADSLIFACIVGLLLVLLGELVSFILGSNPTLLSGTAPLVARYFAICAFSNLPFTLMQVQCAVFRADGHNKRVLILWLTAACFEIVVSNILIVGCGWKSLEAQASAWGGACLIAASVGFFLLKQMLETFELRKFLQATFMHHRQNITAILKVGVPIALSELGTIGSGILNLHIVSTLPQAHLCEAAWAIKSRLDEAIEIVPITAIGLTVVPFIATNLSSLRRRRLCQAFRTSIDAVVLAFAIMILLVLCAQFFAPFAVAQLCEEPELRFQATRLFTVGAAAWPLFAISQILFSTLEGMGAILAATLGSLICAIPLRLGLAVILKDCNYCTFISGMTGITAAGILAQAAFAALMIILVYREYRRRLT